MAHSISNITSYPILLMLISCVTRHVHLYNFTNHACSHLNLQVCPSPWLNIIPHFLGPLWVQFVHKSKVVPAWILEGTLAWDWDRPKMGPTTWWALAGGIHFPIWHIIFEWRHGFHFSRLETCLSHIKEAVDKGGICVSPAHGLCMRATPIGQLDTS